MIDDDLTRKSYKDFLEKQNYNLRKRLRDEEAERKRRLEEIERTKMNETYSLIISIYERELTQEEKKAYLAIDEEKIRSNMLHILCCMGKEIIANGKIDEETFRRFSNKKPKEVTFTQIPEKWKKDPRPWKQEEKEEEGESR